MTDAEEKLAKRLFATEALSGSNAVQRLESLDRKFSSFDGWVFRGHCSVKRGLETELERAFARHRITSARERRNSERLLLREFGRRAHLYLERSVDLPDPGDTLEWMSMLRHYGGPTRLLDWTYSLFVATFFALASSDRGKPCYVWGINTGSLKSPPPSNAYDRTGQEFRVRFMNTHKPDVFVAAENPLRLNRRLSLQRGVFLCPGDVGKSFVQNLQQALSGSRDAVQIRIMPSARKSIGRLLHRLNIDHEVLFSDIGGLAQALRDRLPHLRDLIPPREQRRLSIESIGRTRPDGTRSGSIDSLSSWHPNGTPKRSPA